MKQVILILILFVNLSLFAQDDSTKGKAGELFKIDIREKLISDYKIRKDWKDEYLSENVVEFSQLNASKEGNDILIQPTISNKYNMPVLVPKVMPLMPISKPDPAIKYHILIKGKDELAYED